MPGSLAGLRAAGSAAREICATSWASTLLPVIRPMRLYVVFPPPGFFVADVPIEVRLDGEPIYRGSFTSGFRVEVEATSGPHVLEASIGLGFLRRKRSWSVALPEGSADHVAQISYSRMWGNFEEKLTLHEGEGVARFVRAKDGKEGEKGENGEKSNEGEPGDGDHDELPSYPVRVTWAMLAALVVLMGLEYALPVSPREGLSPSVDTLDAFGGLGASALRDGELYRLVACTFLHADPVHLALNGLSLVMAGFIVERKLGAFWFSVVYGASAIGGSLMSLALNRGNMISVGASGAILGLFAAGMVLAGAYPASQRMPLRMQLGRVLVPSLLPMLDVHGATVDFGAHLGGAAVGFVVGATLLAPLRAHARSHARVSRHDPSERPSFHASLLAKALSALAVVLAVVAFGGVAIRAYPSARERTKLLATLVPSGELPAKGGPTDAQFVDWLARYPKDPHVLLWSAERALERRDAATFERSIREGRESIVRTRSLFAEEARDAFAKAFDEIESERARLLLVPNSELPSGTPLEIERGWATKLPDFKARFPNDPRVRMELAIQAYDAHDPKTALTEISAAREAEPAIRKFFKKPLDLRFLSGIEVISLSEVGRKQESEALARRVCAGEQGENAQSLLTSRDMCHP